MYYQPMQLLFGGQLIMCQGQHGFGDHYLVSISSSPLPHLRVYLPRVVYTFDQGVNDVVNSHDI